jgi:hypothetical protein
MPGVNGREGGAPSPADIVSVRPWFSTNVHKPRPHTSVPDLGPRSVRCQAGVNNCQAPGPVVALTNTFAYRRVHRRGEVPSRRVEKR